VKIYTRTGDSGETGLFGGGRVPKNDPRVEAYGDVDELNAALGLGVTVLEREGMPDFAERILHIQEDLFSIGAHLATPGAGDPGGAAAHLPTLPVSRIVEMERWIDEADERLSPLRTFILPGGDEAAAHLHLARTVCRRAERRVITLAALSAVDGSILIYLNRLSDLLFTFARLANLRAGQEDVPWTGRR
jgi:cob(I)alamin adenosyltransferase